MEITNLKKNTYHQIQYICIIIYTVLNNAHNLAHLITRDYFSPGIVVFNSLNVLILFVIKLRNKNYHHVADHLFFSVFIVTVMAMNFFEKNLFYQNNLLLAYPIIISIMFSRKRNIIIYSSVVVIYFSITQFFFRDSISKEFFSILLIFIIFIVSGYIYSDFVHNLEKKDKKASTELFNTSLTLLGRVAELKDVETHNHLVRVPIIIELITQRLKNHSKYNKILSGSYIENIIKASILHDIGKIAIDDSILLKRGKLSDKEFDKMKLHTIVGAELLQDAQLNVEKKELFSVAIEIAKYHHERWDGHGYPEGLTGTEIPLAARIMAVADVYDALISKRPYKNALSDDEALNIIKAGSGTQFDPAIVKSFTKIHHKIYPKVKKLL